MRISQRLIVSGVARRAVLAIVAVLLVLVTFAAMSLRPSVVVAKRQASLLAGIEKRSPARIRRLVGENYSDRWEFTRDDLVTTMTDAGSQFLALVVTGENETLEIAGGRAVFTARLVIGGKPVGPAAQEVMRQVNRLEEPFVFTWEKETFLPSSWRLVRVENKALPDDLFGYEPGDIGRAMRGE